MQQQSQDPLRLLACGGANAGTSTLIGRLRLESAQPLGDPPAALETAAEKHGSRGDGFGPPREGRAAAREPGGGIDVSYHHFAGGQRKFILADAPGAAQYTLPMLRAAASADAALLLVDAQLGLGAQTRRHACLASLIGIRHLVLAVNKMDLVGFDAAGFERIEEALRQFALPLGFDSVTAIPTCALAGDNLLRRSARTPWYAGPTLMACLETLKIAPPSAERLVFPVQGVDASDAAHRGYSGSVAEGRVQPGDEIRVTASGQSAKVTEILTPDASLGQGRAGDAVTLRLDKVIDAARGDVLSLLQRPLETTDQFEAALVWLSDAPGLVGRSYDIELAAQSASASITAIKYRVNLDTLAHEAGKTLVREDIGVCNLASGKPLAFDNCRNSRTLGSFILQDSYSHATVAAGMIRHSLRRAQNVHKQLLSIARPERERLNRHRGRVIWFTGLSGSGKSTLANALEVALHAQGRRTYVLDGDNLRQGLNRDLGFTDADRVENIRRIAEVARLMLDAGLIVMTAFISPFRRERDMARELIGAEHFVEVYVSTPLAVCEQRDAKGLYKKARSGQLPNMTGVSSPYEVPQQPDLALDCSDAPVAAGVAELIARLQL